MAGRWTIRVRATGVGVGFQTGPPRLAHGDLRAHGDLWFSTLALRFQKRKSPWNMKQRIEGVTRPTPPTPTAPCTVGCRPAFTREPLMLFKVLERQSRTRVPYAGVGFRPPRPRPPGCRRPRARHRPCLRPLRLRLRGRPHAAYAETAQTHPAAGHFDRDRHLRRTRPGRPGSPRCSEPSTNSTPAHS